MNEPCKGASSKDCYIRWFPWWTLCDRTERGSDGVPSSHRKQLLKGTGESGMSQKSSMASQYRETQTSLCWGSSYSDNIIRVCWTYKAPRSGLGSWCDLDRGKLLFLLWARNQLKSKELEEIPAPIGRMYTSVESKEQPWVCLLWECNWEAVSLVM